MREEHHPDEFPPASNYRLLEHALEVLLDRVRRDAQSVWDLRRAVTAQDQTRDDLSYKRAPLMPPPRGWWQRFWRGP
jgi:hypothetical protein